MPVFHGNAVALRAHGKRAGYNFRAVELTQKFFGFLLHLFFFVFDERDHIAEDVERGDAGISRAADGLHGHGHNRFEAEALVNGGEGQNQSDGRAIGIGDHIAATLLTPALDIDELDMARVHFRDHQRHIFLHAQSAGVGNHRAPGMGKAGLELGSNGGIESCENHFGSAVRGRRRDLHLRHGSGNGSFQAPTCCFRIHLAFGAV